MLENQKASVATLRRVFGFIPESCSDSARNAVQIRRNTQQAGRIAARLGNRGLAEDLESILTPGASRVNRIFVGYNHKDRDWLDRLKVMIAPYLREAEAEMDFWDDTRLQAGQQWDVEIHRALERAGVAIALVSSPFLASSYITEYELPAMIKASVKVD